MNIFIALFFVVFFVFIVCFVCMIVLPFSGGGWGCLCLFLLFYLGRRGIWVFFNLSYIPVESLDVKMCIHFIYTCNKRSVLFFPILYI